MIPEKEKARLKKYELKALRYFGEPDWENLDPVLVLADKKHAWLYNYLRYVVSSEPQKMHDTGQGRSTYFLVFDRTTRNLLGGFSLVDYSVRWKVIDRYIWRDKEPIRRNHIFRLGRCLPVRSFGQLLGGKLLAMLATSKEAIRTVELKYSYKVAALTIKTLHGKAVMYDRLPNFNFIGEDENGYGYYFVPLRKKALQFLRGEQPEGRLKGKLKPASQIIEEWRERWYSKRLPQAHKVRHDRARYAISRCLV